MRRLWVPHPQLVWAPCWLHDIIDGIATFATEDGEAFEVGTQGIEDLEEVQPQQVVGVDNVCLLDTVTKAALLQTVRARFKKQTIHTWVSRILLAVNPFQALPLYSSEMLDKYRYASEPQVLPPHVFCIAADALSNLQISRKDQAIVINGESGAGKTESAKLVMSYVAEATKSSETQKQSQGFEEKVLRTNPVMEAFGNAMTVRNNNSSRFVKWLNFQLEDDRLIGCEIQQYLLEGTRVCSVAKGERTYHVFFQMLQARRLPLLEKLELEDPSCYQYTKAGEFAVPGMDDVLGFEELREAFAPLGIDDAMQVQIFQVLAAVLNLGNCTFRAEREDRLEVLDEGPVQRAAKLLSLPVEDLKKCMLVRKIAIGRDIVESPQREDQAIASRDSLSKCLYMQLFAWAVDTLNRTLHVNDAPGTPDKKRQYLGILDIAGFECFDHNSLEQLLINLCNEHLQQFFNTFVFRSELDDYAKEGLKLVCDVQFRDNADVLQLVDGRGGLLDMLDEEVVMPKATDESFVSKVKSGHSKHPCFVQSKINNRVKFGVKHFAGEVTYNCEGFLKKNADKPPDDFLQLLSCSELDLLKQLAREPGQEASSPVSPTKSNNRKPKSTSSKFRSSLRVLIGKISSSDPHFIRCIKPNAQKVPGLFDSKMVLEQLLFSGVLEAVHIRQQGYASRLSYGDFFSRYASLGSRAAQGSASDLARHLKEKLALDLEVGKSKVFMKASAASVLEKERGLMRARMAIRLQALVRARIARSRFSAARPAMKALMNCLRRIGWDARKPETDQPVPILGRLGPDVKAFLTELEQAESALPHLPSSDRLRSTSQAAFGRLTKEQQCLELLEGLAKSTDFVEIEKALARATSLQLPPTPLTEEHLPLRCKALQLQVPLVEALRSALDEKNVESLTRIIDEVGKKGLKLDPSGWLPELAVGDLLQQVDAQRLQHQERQMRDAEARRQLEQKQQQQEQQQQRQAPAAQPAPAEPPQAPAPTASVGKQAPAPSHPPQPLQTAPSQPEESKRSQADSRRRRPTITGFSSVQQAQLLASLQRAAENLDSAALEQLLHEATRNGIEAAELKEYHKKMCDLQSEAFLRQAVEQVLEEVKAECPPSNALQKLQNLSHQLRVLHGDAELIRSASQAVQQGTRRRTKSIAPSAHMRRASAFDVKSTEELRVAREAFGDLSSFSKLKSEGTWKGHRSSQLHQLELAPFIGKMLGHSKVTIAESLTHLPKSREAAAVQTFRNILIWMGDRPAQECQRIASRESVINSVSSDPLMRDETFVQILKQLTGNPSARSEWLGWQLLLQLCHFTPPSDELDDFVRFFCVQKTHAAPLSSGDARALELDRIARECMEALTAAAPAKATDDTSGDMVGVLVYLIDGSSQNLFVPVATTLKDMSSLMGSRVGVKHWRDFAFFQTTGKGESLRMLPDILPVSELISMWQKIREATGLTGHLHWRRRFLWPQEMLQAGDLHHAALTFRQAVRSHLHRPAPCQAGAEAEEMMTAAALLWLESYNPLQQIKDNDRLVHELLKGQMSGLKPTQQDAIRQRLQAKVKDLRKEYGPRVPQLQRMTRAFALMRCFPHFGTHHWPAKGISAAKVHAAGNAAVSNPPDKNLVLHLRQTEPELWIFVDTFGLHLAPALASHTSGAALWSFLFQDTASSGDSEVHNETSPSSPATAYSRRRSLSEMASDDGATTPSVRRNIRLPKQCGRLLRWGAKPGALQLVVHSADLGRSGPILPQLISLACPDALDAAFVVHSALCELLHLPTTCS
ncbi:Myo5a [Symbiodinium natans]|uniref:Myo5a protein n=1 Tax=Symbiodinium natans TaxID=878477 RepID=A0A812UJG8_9DINO|nr:Myo5a [Symbiodinium natans]